MMRVSELWIYPIKSCGGIAVEQLMLDDRGPENDRRWMLVDKAGRFISQREVPRLTLIDVALDNGTIRVGAPGMDSLSFAASSAHGAQACTVWRDTVGLQHVSTEVDRWFSEFARVECRLMHMPATTERVVNPDYAPARRLVTLADAFPMLLIGTGSLDLLNDKLEARGQPPVPMNRFRPNVVAADVPPHQEDEWRAIRIGALDCEVVKPCARCVIPNVDLATGRPGVEPLRTLATYRKQGSKVFFGQNVMHAAPGVIRRGDDVVILGNSDAPNVRTAETV